MERVKLTILVNGTCGDSLLHVFYLILYFCQLEYGTTGQVERFLFRGTSDPRLQSSPIALWHPQLALYKAEHYLKCLQGDILPWIIGVYSLPGSISIAMEPPHHSFWIEASPDMPTVLKQRCIEAFENIHQRGVLHGAVELRHMLIGGDCKVTIIDFQMSRSLVPNADVMLLQAEPWELSLEMRKVKYKLDYDGARKREIEKMMRGEERNRRNGARQTDSEAGVQHEDTPEEDIVDPPIHIQDWNESWANAAANATPTRFVMPGQPTEALANEVQNFLDIVDRISTGSLTLARSEHRLVRFASEAPSTVFVDNLPWEESRTLSIHNSTHSYGMRKRKASKRSESSGSIHDTFAKRSRSGGDLIMSLSPDIDEPIHPNLPADPVLVNYVANDTNNNDRFTPPTESADAFPGTVAISANPSLRFPPIKVRDFAYESYDGPRGYYAPYPLMESVISLNRRRWIRLQNQARVELGLPIPQPLSKIPTRSSHLSTRKHSESTQSLGLNKGRTVTEGVPVPVQKRKRGDQETEMLEEDFEEDDGRANKVFINMDRNGHRLSVPVAGSLSLDLRGVQYPYEREVLQQSQHHRPNRVPGSRTDHMVFADRAMPPGRNVSFKYPKVSDKIAFATLGRRPPASRQKSISKARTRLFDNGPTEASQSYGGPPPRRHHRPSVSWQRQEPIDPYLSLASEDEVEALLSPPRVAVSPPPRSLPLVSSWMGLLLQWIL